MPTAPLRLGTRGSLLARSQSQLVADAIEKANPSVRVEMIIVQTTGDQVQDQPLAEIGGKGLFTKELELALLRNQIDLAVHSYKDVPATMPLVDQTELVIACAPKRADPRDLLITRDASVQSIRDLPHAASVATGSARRICQLLNLRPDLRIEPIRGNIDSRIKRVLAGEFDATILAAAGVERAGLLHSPTFTHVIMSIDEITPSAGQGALALQTRRNDADTLVRIAPLNNAPTLQAVEIEREVVRLLNGDCHSPIGVYVHQNGDRLCARGCIGEPEGGLPVRHASVEAPQSDAATVAPQLVSLLHHRR